MTQNREQMAKTLYADSIRKREEEQERIKLLNEFRDHLTPAQRMYATKKI